MRRIQTVLTLILGLALLTGYAVLAEGSAVAASGKPASSTFHYGNHLTDAELVGAEIWFNATAGNARFFTYVYQQRLGVMIDWYRVLRSDAHDERFYRWGLINDPDCCKPGDPNCPAKSLRRDLWLRLLSGRRRTAQVCGEARISRSCLRSERRAACEGRSAWSKRCAPVGLRPRIRHVDRSAWAAQISQSEVRQGEMAQD